jgi:phosphatidylserine decarboxylase
MRFSVGVALQYLLPQKLLCRVVYRLSRSRRPWLRKLLIRGFVALYDVDLGEAATDDIDAFATFNDFFTRALAPGARPLAGDDSVIACPADGRLTEFGRLDADRLLQAKGISFTAGSLLGETPELLERFHGGSFLTIYLAPHDYHRVHAPVAGQLDRCRYIPGRRFSVNLATASAIDGLFCRNERVALWLSSDVGYAVVVMVGALNVSSLTTALTGEIESGPERLVAPAVAPVLARGDELGRFNLGSTVIAMLPRGAAEWDETLAPGQTVRMGQALGRLLAPGRGAPPA